jgi:CBS domain-containing protein
MSIESIAVSSCMSSKGVITETADQNIYSACRTMHKNNIGCVIIVDENGGIRAKPVGIITERDVVRLLGRLDASSLHLPLRNIMSKPLVTISVTSSIKDAIQTMQQKKIRRLAIVDKEKIAGIITDKDIFRAIINNQTLVSSMVSNELKRGHGTEYEQFTEYWFRDIFHKQ